MRSRSFRNPLALSAAFALYFILVATGANADNCEGIPIGKGKKIDLARYEKTFTAEFSKPNITNFDKEGPWFAREHFYFGGSRFAAYEPNEGIYSFVDGHLSIRLEKQESGWRSGLLQSVDWAGRGFSQAQGYFEISAQLPPDPTAWPAFWLKNTDEFLQKNSNFQEIDAFELLVDRGKMPRIHMAVLDWLPDKTPSSINHRISEQACDTFLTSMDDVSQGFHTFGVDIGADWITFYFDRQELAKLRPNSLSQKPMFMIISLAYREKEFPRGPTQVSNLLINSVGVWRRRM